MPEVCPKDAIALVYLSRHVSKLCRKEWNRIVLLLESQNSKDLAERLWEETR
jgi:hypothetical protein